MADADSTGSSKGWLERLLSVFSAAPQNKEQLIELLRNFQQHQIINPDELVMIEGVFQVSSMQGH